MFDGKKFTVIVYEMVYFFKQTFFLTFVYKLEREKDFGFISFGGVSFLYNFYNNKALVVTNWKQNCQHINLMVN